MKLWAGRFQKETDSAVNDFNSSIAFDARLYRQDITGSIAHATMLGEQTNMRFAKDELVAAALRFSTREYNGQVYQDIVVNEIVKL